MSKRALQVDSTHVTSSVRPPPRPEDPVARHHPGCEAGINVSARRQGIEDADISHAFAHAVFSHDINPEPAVRRLHPRPDRSGDKREVVLVLSDDGGVLAIHERRSAWACPSPPRQTLSVVAPFRGGLQDVVHCVAIQWGLA
jgi:hypothetical protein